MSSFFKKFLAMFLGVFVALFLLEIVCQAYFAFAVVKQLEAQRQDPLHYYVTSDDPVFSYQLKPGYRMEKDGKRIAINNLGFRDDSDSTAAKKKVALLGDSVPFGIALSQEETPTAYLQTLAGDSIKILTYATPGYGLEEIAHFLEVKFPAYRPQVIYYMLNLNDFSRRNTIYEGADNGLYRIYDRPFFKMPFFIRKAIYRFVKQGKMSSVPWYQWMYEGNKKAGLNNIERMAKFASENGSELRVVMFPPGVAYENGNFTMLKEFAEIRAFLQERGIRNFAPVADFSQNTAVLIDNTDHFTPAGSEVMATAIWRDLKNW
ncbi:MAG: hypothetical protein AAB316_03165 [Bacteroidota bacterium]